MEVHTWPGDHIEDHRFIEPWWERTPEPGDHVGGHCMFFFGLEIKG